MEKTTRRKLRIDLMTTLYQLDFYQEAKVQFNPQLEFSENEEVFTKISNNLKEIDQAIERNLFNYDLHRLSFVDRAIIRLATFELLYTDTPVTIIIDEALGITAKFSNLDDNKQKRFNNKLLDNIAKDVRKDVK